MNFYFMRYFLLFVGILALMRWLRGSRRWRRRWDRVPAEAGRSVQDLAGIEDRLSVVERLESRVEELENRLDFTERLLADRSASQHQIGQAGSVG